MKYWTIQSAKVVEILNAHKAYFPDFAYSTYAGSDPEMGKLYAHLLRSFNNRNISILGSKFNGLVFCFAEWNSPFVSRLGGIVQIPDYQTFLNAMREYGHLLDPILKRYAGGGHYILELDIPDMYFNPIPIEFNNLQAITPPVTVSEPYDEKTLHTIWVSISEGWFHPQVVPGNKALVQVHLPCIFENWVKSSNRFEI